MQSRRLVLFAIALATLFFAGTLTVSAQEPGGAEQMFEVQLEVGPDGSWAVPSLGGLDLGLSSETIAALSDLLNLQLQAPAVDPALVQTALASDVQNLALVKEGDRTTILVNNQPLSALTLSDQAVGLVQSFTPRLEEMVEGLHRSHITVGVHFAGAAAEQALDTSARLPAAEAPAEPVNLVDLGVTLSPQGELVSVGGLTPAELGIVAPRLDISFLQRLGIQDLQADVLGTGVALQANAAPLASLEWNVPELKRVPDLVTRSTGMALTAETQHGVDVAMNWLQDSLISVSTALADSPQESLPRISLGRPVIVEVASDNRLEVEGFLIQTGMEDMIASYRTQVQSAALVWDGASGRLRTMANGAPLPALRLEKDFLTTAMRMFVGGTLNWDKVADAAMNVDLTVAAVAAGSPTPDLAVAQYQPQPGARLVTAVPMLKISRSEGSVAIFDEKLPLQTVEGLLNVAITDPVRQTASAYAGVQKARLTMGPAGIEVGLNGTSAFLEWDNSLRNNMVDLAARWAFGETDPAIFSISETGGGSAGMPGFLREVRMSMIKGLLGILNQVEIGVEIELQDDPLRPGMLVEFAEGLDVLGFSQ